MDMHGYMWASDVGMRIFFLVRAWKFVREKRPAWLSHVAQGQGTWPRSAVRFVNSIRGHM